VTRTEQSARNRTKATSDSNTSKKVTSDGLKKTCEGVKIKITMRKE
jgi:hypothetical protein